MKVLITGVAGFIGMHCAERLLARGDEVVGVDNLSPYYSVELKKDRLARLKGLRFEQLDIADNEALTRLFRRERFDGVLNLGNEVPPGPIGSLKPIHAFTPWRAP